MLHSLSKLHKMPQTMGLQCYLYSLPKPLTGLESKVFPRQKSVHCQQRNSLSTIISVNRASLAKNFNSKLRRFVLTEQV